MSRLRMVASTAKRKLWRLWQLWSAFWLAFAWPAGLMLAVIVPNCYEAYVHNVSFYDAVFIESWDKTDTTQSKRKHNKQHSN